MSDTRTYYVVSEDGDSMRREAESAQHAADAARDEWGLEAEEGYRLHVFDAADAIDFEFKSHLVPSSGLGRGT